MTAHAAREIAVGEAARRGIAGLIADAERGEDIVVTRRNNPVAAVVSMRRLEELDELADDLRDLALVVARTATDSGRRTSMDDVLDAFGLSRAQLDARRDDK